MPPLFLAVAVQPVGFVSSGAILVMGAYSVSFALIMLGVTVTTADGHGIAAGRIAGSVDWFMRVAGMILVLSGFGQLFVALAY